MDSIPNEILSHIFNYIPSKTQRLLCGVCRRWNAVLNSYPVVSIVKINIAPLSPYPSAFWDHAVWALAKRRIMVVLQNAVTAQTRVVIVTYEALGNIEEPREPKDIHNGENRLCGFLFGKIIDILRQKKIPCLVFSGIDLEFLIYVRSFPIRRGGGDLRLVFRNMHFRCCFTSEMVPSRQFHGKPKLFQLYGINAVLQLKGGGPECSKDFERQLLGAVDQNCLPLTENQLEMIKEIAKTISEDDDLALRILYAIQRYESVLPVKISTMKEVEAHLVSLMPFVQRLILELVEE